MAELFQRDCSVITKHIKNVFEEGELARKSNVQIFHITIFGEPVTGRGEKIRKFRMFRGGIGGGIKRASKIHGVIASKLS